MSLLARASAQAASGRGAGGGGSGGGGSGSGGSKPAGCFVVDARSEESRVAARAAAMRGLALRLTGADITNVYAGLDDAWRYGAFAVAGVTTSNAVFALERLAAHRGLRTVYRGVHALRSDGTFAHALEGPRELTRLGRTMAAGSWPAALGQDLAEWAHDGTRTAAALPPLPARLVDGKTLVSWLLAPRARAA